MVSDKQSLSIVIENPASQNTKSAVAASVRTRKYHTKSRNGCLICKRRHIKCDEAQPECTYCWEKGICCQYPTPLRSQSIAKECIDSPYSPHFNRHDVLAESVETRALLALEQHNIPCNQFENPVYKRSDAVQLLRYFVETTDRRWIGSSKCQNIMQKHCLGLAFDASYLLHALLAYSAAFLELQYPEDRKYSIAATLHYQKSLQHYHRHLNTEFREEDADAMMASSILLSMLSFVHTAAIERQDRQSNAPSWVRSMQGTQILIQTPVLRRGLWKGIWSENVQGFYEWNSKFLENYLEISVTNTEDVAQLRTLGNLCSTAPIQERELYTAPLFMLEYLAQLPPTIEIGSRFIYFISLLPNEFIELLNAEDPCAMLIIAFWCAFLSRIDQWWIVGSATSECRRICHFIADLDHSRLDGVAQYLHGLCQRSKDAQ